MTLTLKIMGFSEEWCIGSFFLKVEEYQSILEILTPKGVFIGFPY